ncbi:hypothetical protein M427DRAFT_41696 [Gonapodya prolifera JEL478]|uniref:Cytochrome P450 n=1 Tax=Gonapodya prolifera (strain JEL478) TaxID=1344416 RepID=A0A139AT64_GONPJ|nr:hypothetical protein M427DRAFT_41696 [Gonapodya prolifera JEL478]|eukprot:KXS19874.1 hypothetical protein M427DRAFT_41696 [Gonapodya prolifera JEL478]
MLNLPGEGHMAIPLAIYGALAIFGMLVYLYFKYKDCTLGTCAHPGVPTEFCTLSRSMHPAPVNGTLPILGGLGAMASNGPQLHEFFLDQVQKKGKVFCITVPKYPKPDDPIVTMNVHDIEHILRDPYMYQKGEMKNINKDVFGKQILVPMGTTGNGSAKLPATSSTSRHKTDNPSSTAADFPLWQPTQTLSWVMYEMANHPEIFAKPFVMGRLEWIQGPDAGEIKPEQWIDENGNLIKENNYKWMAFNTGLWLCISIHLASTFGSRSNSLFDDASCSPLGMNMETQEAMILLSTIVRKFDFKLINEDDPAKWGVWNNDPSKRRGRCNVKITLALRKLLDFRVSPANV